ncbi:MAG: prohibitin family protein [Alphaproteobacteria bacterium]
MDNQDKAMFKITGAVVAVAIITPIVLWGGWYTVDEGERAVILRNGSNIGVAGPGLHFKIPLIDGVERVSIRSHSIEWTGESAMHTYSRDQQPAVLSLKLVWRIKPDDASVSQVYSQYKDADGIAGAIIMPTAYEKVKTEFGQFNAITAVQERERLNNVIEQGVQSRIKGPVIVESVQLQNIDYSEEYEKAIGDRMVAQVAVERVTQNLKRDKKQAEITIVNAEAAAKEIRLIGDAKAAALKAQGDAIMAAPDIVALKAAEKWDGVLPTTMPPGGTVPFIKIPENSVARPKVNDRPL